MNRSTRLQPIVKLANHREKEASVQLAETQERLDEHQTMLRNLEQYHAEYTCSDVMFEADAVRLQDLHIFIDRLAHAITRQRELVSRVRAELEAHRSNWTSQRSQRQALDNVTARYAQDEAQDAERDEQRLMDEVASLLTGRRPVQ